MIWLTQICEAGHVTVFGNDFPAAPNESERCGAAGPGHVGPRALVARVRGSNPRESELQNSEPRESKPQMTEPQGFDCERMVGLIPPGRVRRAGAEQGGALRYTGPNYRRPIRKNK